MPKPARPTQRCLHEDLGEDWRSAPDRAAASGDISDVTSELHDLDHPIIAKAAHEFDGSIAEDGDLKREGITDLSDPMWFKVKVGRWRGAVYEDPDGQAWLCAAGYRRGKEATDFYQAFMASVNAGGPNQYLPSPDDVLRLKDELSEGRFVEWERQLLSSARDWMFDARRDGMLSELVLDPDGEPLLELSIAYSEDEVDGTVVSDIYLEFICKDWAQYELVEWAEVVICLSIDPREQVWRPVNVPDGRAYSFVLDGDECEEFYSAMEGELRQPGEVHAGSESHWTHRERLTESTVLGHAVKSLCGRWFVPRQDTEDKPKCRHCDTLYDRLH